MIKGGIVTSPQSPQPKRSPSRSTCKPSEPIKINRHTVSEDFPPPHSPISEIPSPTGPTRGLLQDNVNLLIGSEAGASGSIPISPEDRPPGLTMGVLLEELQRHTGRNTEDDTDQGPSRYVLSGHRPAAHLNSVVEMHDFLQRNLYVRAKRRTPKGTFVDVWAYVRNGMLSIYSGEATPRPENCLPGDFFEDPGTSGTFYRRYTQFPIISSSLYVSKRQEGCLSCCFCCSSFIDPTKLIEISDVHINSISPQRRKYALRFSQEGGDKLVMLHDLDVVMWANNTYYYFRLDSIDTFLRWVLLFRLRRRREVPVIEQLDDVSIL